ncbi:hypothetical protein BHM03_00012735 [Ensete ventricosum]|nr:hypothetical protein BHM03_00012735 [Ensete ventricosum]
MASATQPRRQRPLPPAATGKHTSSSPPLQPLLPVAEVVPCYSLRYTLPPPLACSRGPLLLVDSASPIAHHQWPLTAHSLLSTAN